MRKWIIIGLIIYCFVLKYMLSALLPFLLAFLFYLILKPLIDFLESYFHIRRSAIGISLLLIIYFFIIFIVFICLFYCINYSVHFIERLPDIYQTILNPIFNEIVLIIDKYFSYLINQDLLIKINEYSYTFILKFISYISSFLSQLPHYLFSFFLFIISTFFLVIEYDEMKEYFLGMFSDDLIESFYKFKNIFMKSIYMFFKCQMILMIICFVILLFGFYILHIQNAFIYALITCLLDSLPFIGVGIVLLPISIVYLLQNAYLRAFYIFLIYLIINLMRSVLEPHIMNKQSKVPSFVLLVSMIVHLYLFGFVGICLSPIHMNLLFGYLNYKKLI